MPNGQPSLGEKQAKWPSASYEVHLATGYSLAPGCPASPTLCPLPPAQWACGRTSLATEGAGVQPGNEMPASPKRGAPGVSPHSGPSSPGPLTQAIPLGFLGSCSHSPGGGGQLGVGMTIVKTEPYTPSRVLDRLGSPSHNPGGAPLRLGVGPAEAQGNQVTSQ